MPATFLPQTVPLSKPASSTPPDAVLLGGGEMAHRIVARDWKGSVLGPRSGWPQSLQTTLSIMLASRTPMCLAWGPELTLFYNEGYRQILGTKEPTALGLPLAQVWPEIWSDIAPLVDRVMSGESTFSEDMHLLMHRHGHAEDTWWTFSYTPVRDESGAIAGMLNITSESTAKVLNERRLVEDRERLARMFEQAPTFMAMLQGPEHLIEFVNPGYQRLVGHRELVGRTIAEALPDAVEQGYLVLLDQVYASGEAFAANGAKYTVQPERGGPASERYVDFVFQPISDDDGRVVGIFVEGVDVTDRALADIALREREAQLSALNRDLERQVAERAQERSRTWQVTPDLLLVLSPEGLLEKTNPAWQQLLGWNEDELAMQPFARFVHPDDLAASNDVFAKLKQGQPVLQFENRYRTKAGDYRALSWVATPEAGKYYCSARDVTDVNAATQALATSQAQLRTLFETSYQLQGMCTPDGTLIDANTTALDAIAARFEDVAGQRFWETPWFAGTPGMPDFVRNAFAQAVLGDNVRHEISLMLPVGTRTFDFSMRPIRDARSDVIAVVPEAVDITDRRHAEDALRQSQKLEAMGQLTGGVAHDFNNLLTPIVVALDIAEDGSANAERRQRMLTAARRSADRATTLVQRLLAFARRQPLQSTDVDVGKLVDGMVELIASTCEPRVRVEVMIAPKLAHAVADPNQLEMAILNLSVNARDAMPDGGVLRIAAQNRRITDHAHDGLVPGDYVLLTVADTGHGMDDATRVRAIEPFFSTKGVGKGTGLGLSMVHGLASQLGGRLVIDSTQDVGTTMALWLPVAAHAAMHQQDEDDSVEQPNSNTDIRRVALVVDDEDAVRMCTADVLLDMGYEVVEAASGEAALRAIDDGLVPEILVTDQLMPGMTGSELAKVVQARFPSTPVVVVSGYTNLEDLDPGLVLLNKPFRQRDLMASVAAASGAKA